MWLKNVYPSDMKLLVTGATGFVGSHAAEKFVQDGHEVKALVRPSSDLKWLKGLDVEPITGNVFDVSSLEHAMKGIEGVVHIAGVTAARNKQGFIEGNQIATRNLLEAGKKFAGNLERFVYISSQTAGGPAPNGVPRTEDMTPEPITTYGRSKLAAEHETDAYREFFPATILRLPAIYGPRDTAILTFFQVIAKRIKPLIGFRDKYVNLLHVRDVANGIALGLEKKAGENRLYNIGSDREYNWRELSDIVAEILGKKAIFLNIPHSVVTFVAGVSEVASKFRTKPSVMNWEKRSDIIQPHWRIDTSRAKAELDFVPKIGIEEGFRDTIAWYQKEKWM
jgi:nucleoside-diphosphate-sugar epimerase